MRDPAVIERLLMDFSITTSTMFRDPGFFRCLREKVVYLFSLAKLEIIVYAAVILQRKVTTW